MVKNCSLTSLPTQSVSKMRGHVTRVVQKATVAKFNFRTKHCSPFAYNAWTALTTGPKPRSIKQTKQWPAVNGDANGPMTDANVGTRTASMPHGKFGMRYSRRIGAHDRQRLSNIFLRALYFFLFFAVFGPQTAFVVRLRAALERVCTAVAFRAY